MTEPTVSGDVGRFEVEFRRLAEAAELARLGRRRDGTQLGPKAARTRELLLRAAHEAFVTNGYYGTTVEHIHEAAQVSLGTFYRYFDDKADLMSVLLAEAVLAVTSSMGTNLESDTVNTPVAITAFVRNYAATAPFQRVWEEVNVVEPALSGFRHAIVRLIEAIIRDAVERNQATGAVDDRLDPDLTARALGAMVDRTCLLTFVVDGKGEEEVDRVVANLTRLWMNALRPPPVSADGDGRSHQLNERSSKNID